MHVFARQPGAGLCPAGAARLLPAAATSTAPRLSASAGLSAAPAPAALIGVSLAEPVAFAPALGHVLRHGRNPPSRRAFRHLPRRSVSSGGRLRRREAARGGGLHG